MSTESRELINYYLVLDIRRNATQDDIEMAYAKAALRHHPDVAGDSQEVQDRFAVINEAYSVLSHPDRKVEYDARLSASSITYQEEVISSDDGGASAAPPDRTVSRVRQEKPAVAEPTSAERMSKKRLDKVISDSRKLMSKGDFWRADALLRQALFSFPRDANVRRMLAKAAEGRGRLREAVEDLKAAVEIEYFNPENHYLIGKLYIKANQIDRAERAFRDALSWQEDYQPAIRGIAEIKKMRRSKLPWWKKFLRMES